MSNTKDPEVDTDQTKDSPAVDPASTCSLSSSLVTGWTMESALAWVREHQPNAMRRGWYLALCGGVLNNGHSANDLDLVVMPMTDAASTDDLAFLGIVDAGEKIPAAAHHVVVLEDGRVVELAVVFPTNSIYSYDRPK